MATTNELRNCYGFVEEVPRITRGLLRLCYEFATVLPEVTRSSHVYTTMLMEYYGFATVLRRSIRL